MLAYILAIAPARNGTRVLLTVEGITVLLILITTVIIFAKLAGGHAPDNHHVDWSVFSIPKGTGTSGVFLGVVFGFLSFAGFEAASTLGEETKNPRRDIPRAMLGTAIFGGVYFVVVTAVEVMGFGTDASGVKAYIASGSLLGDLGTKYVGSWIGTTITLGAAVSAFGCCLACVVGASRLTFSLARDGGNASLAKVSEKNSVPVNATRLIVGTSALIMIIWKLVWHVKPFDIFLGSGVIGTLIILVAYLLATVGAIKFLFFSGKKRTKQWEIIIPLAGIALLIYTLYKNVYPFPTSGAARAYPIAAVIWLVIGIVGIVSRPALAARVGSHLTADENLSEARS